MAILITARYFNSILQPTSCLFQTLPPARDPATVSRLRAASKFNAPTSTWSGNCLTAQSRFKISALANPHQKISVIHFFCTVSLPG